MTRNDVKWNDILFYCKISDIFRHRRMAKCQESATKGHKMQQNTKKRHKMQQNSRKCHHSKFWWKLLCCWWWLKKFFWVDHFESLFSKKKIASNQFKLVIVYGIPRMEQKGLIILPTAGGGLGRFLGSQWDRQLKLSPYASFFISWSLAIFELI